MFYKDCDSGMQSKILVAPITCKLFFVASKLETAFVSCARATV